MEHKAYIIYRSHSAIIRKLSREQKGFLLEAIMEYQDTGEILEMDLATEIVFESIRIMFDIDRDKYEKRCEALAENGKKGGRPKKETKQNQTKPNGFSEKQTKAKKPKEEEEEIEEVNEYEEVNKKELENKIESISEMNARKKFYIFMLDHVRNIEEIIDIRKLDIKLVDFLETLGDKRATLELESFCEHHKKENTVFKSTIGRLNTWLSNKIK